MQLFVCIFVIYPVGNIWFGRTIAFHLKKLTSCTFTRQSHDLFNKKVNQKTENRFWIDPFTKRVVMQLIAVFVHSASIMHNIAMLSTHPTKSMTLVTLTRFVKGQKP